MQDIMVVCEELRGDDLATFRSCGQQAGTAVATVPSEAAVAAPSASGLLAIMDVGDAEGDRAADSLQPVAVAPSVDHDHAIRASQWATGYRDLAVLEGILKSLPAAILHEQLGKYGPSPEIVPAKPESEIIICNPTKLSNREAVARKFIEYTRSRGVVIGVHTWGFTRSLYVRVLASSRKRNSLNNRHVL